MEKKKKLEKSKTRMGLVSMLADLKGEEFEEVKAELEYLSDKVLEQGGGTRFDLPEEVLDPTAH